MVVSVGDVGFAVGVVVRSFIVARARPTRRARREMRDRGLPFAPLRSPSPPFAPLRSPSLPFTSSTTIDLSISPSPHARRTPPRPSAAALAAASAAAGRGSLTGGTRDGQRTRGRKPLHQTFSLDGRTRLLGAARGGEHVVDLAAAEHEPPHLRRLDEVARAWRSNDGVVARRTSRAGVSTSTT